MTARFSKLAVKSYIKILEKVHKKQQITDGLNSEWVKESYIFGKKTIILLRCYVVDDEGVPCFLVNHVNILK